MVSESVSGYSNQLIVAGKETNACQCECWFYLASVRSEIHVLDISGLPSNPVCQALLVMTLRVDDWWHFTQLEFSPPIYPELCVTFLVFQFLFKINFQLKKMSEELNVQGITKHPKVWKYLGFHKIGQAVPSKPNSNMTKCVCWLYKTANALNGRCKSVLLMTEKYLWHWKGLPGTEKDFCFLFYAIKYRFQNFEISSWYWSELQ